MQRILYRKASGHKVRAKAMKKSKDMPRMIILTPRKIVRFLENKGYKRDIKVHRLLTSLSLCPLRDFVKCVLLQFSALFYVDHSSCGIKYQCLHRLSQPLTVSEVSVNANITTGDCLEKLTWFIKRRNKVYVWQKKKKQFPHDTTSPFFFPFSRS